MAFAIANVKVYPVKGHTPLQSQFLQVCTFTLTALASDTAANLKTIAEASAVAGASQLAAALSVTSKVISVFSDVSARATTASGSAYSLVATAPTAPVLTFTGTASTPLTQEISIVLQPATDAQPVIYLG